ncbi:AI-2E family transporter [soil metagenome]
MSHRTRLIWWIAGFVVFGLVLWRLGAALAPYIAAAILAYLLDPVAERMERAGMNRIVASLLLAGVAVLAVLGIVAAAIPLIVGQVAAFVEALPDILADFSARLEDAAPGIEGRQMLRDSVSAAQEVVQEHGMTAVTTVLASTARIADVIVFVLLAPLAAFFLVVNWNRMVAAIDGWLPRDQAPTIRRLARDMDTALGGFIRGQLVVVLIMTVYYSAGLTLVGLPYGFAVGVVAGIGTIIPFVGATIGSVLALGVALASFWGEWLAVGLVAAVYFGGQLVEGNVLTPKLVGQYVGLHPLWLLLAFSVFATLFGFLGIIVAAPAAAMLAVLVRFAFAQYLDSPLYTGQPPEEP